MLLWKDGKLKYGKHPLVEGFPRDAMPLFSCWTDAENTLYILSLHHTQIFFILILRNTVALASGQLALSVGICIVRWDKIVFFSDKKPR